MEWSHFQKRIYEFVEKETGSGVVIAVAGSGKTSTLVESTKRFPSSSNIIALAFNVNIANELKKRVPANCTASTLNGMGHRAITKHLGGFIKVDKNKVSWIMDDNMEPETIKQYGSGLRKLVALAKAHGLAPKGVDGVGLLMDTEQNWADLIDRYGIEFEGEAKPERGIELARNILTENIKRATGYRPQIDFDDQMYLSVIWQVNFPKYDVILVDECQDISPIQRAMIRMALPPGGRMLAFGDPRQSIYSFRGADVESVERIKQEFNATELPLSVSYRCPRAVVAEAQKYVPYIEPSDTAPEGKITTVDTYDAEIFQKTDAILCRLNAPLISFAYKLIRGGKPCRVRGRDIGQGLVSLIKKMKAASLDDLEVRLSEYREREVRKLLAKKEEDKAASIDDKVESIMVFIEQVPEGERTIEKLITTIEGLFSDSTEGILTLSSVHRAKGLEYDRVFILDRQNMPLKWARQAWMQAQETNIIYVAITRARQELLYIDSDKWRDKKTEELNGAGRGVG